MKKAVILVLVIILTMIIASFFLNSSRRVKLTYNVIIEDSPGGSTVPATGKYRVYNETFLVKAQPEKFWTFKKWVVNDSLIFENPNLVLDIRGNTTLKPIFERRKCTVNLLSNITQAIIIVNYSATTIPCKLTVPCGSVLNLTPIQLQDYVPLNDTMVLFVEDDTGLVFKYTREAVPTEFVNKPECEDGICIVRYPPIFATSVVKEDGLEKYVLSVCMWNLKSATGNIEVKHFKNKIYISVDVENAKAIDPEKRVVGFPEVWIGCKPWGNPCANAFWNVSFPTRSYNLELSVDYKLVKKKGVINVAFDMWFVATNDKKVDPTLNTETVELMIWLYYDKDLASWMFTRIKSVEMPVIVEGERVLLKFYVFHYRMPWHYIAVLPENPAYLNGKGVVIDLKDIITNLRELYPEVPLYDKWLFGIELGTEFIEGDSSFTLKIGKFTICRS